jgi:hypothetical protein
MRNFDRYSQKKAKMRVFKKLFSWVRIRKILFSNFAKNENSDSIKKR